MVSEDVRIAEKARISIEAQAKYRESHREQLHMWDVKYRKKHRNELLERKKLLRRRFLASLSDVKLAELSREQSDRNQEYRHNNRERIQFQGKIWREKHKVERQEYDRKHQLKRKLQSRQNRLGTVLNGKSVLISNIKKRPYPEPAQCELCGRTGLKRLVYHHIDDLTGYVPSQQPFFLHGIWVCQPCNVFIHKLEEHPYLPEKWFRMKEILLRQGGYE